MVSFIVRLRFDAAESDEIAVILHELQAASRQEPGCVSYIAHFVEGTPGTVLIYEQYKDSAALEFHRETAHFKRYAIGGLYQKMLERHVENLNAVD